MRMILRGVGIALCCLLAVACRGPAPPPPVPAEEPEAGPVAAEDAMQMTGINLYMHRRIPLDGAPGKPELWVRADSFSIEDQQTYSFENASAVIYGREEEITLEAQRGQFEQDKSAVLEGEVRLAAGTLRMLLTDIQWHRGDEEEAGGVVETGNPVIIDDPDLQLNAAGMRLYPDTRVYELTEVSGVVRFGKELM